MYKGYTPTIGLEIHAHLKTQTKMFSDSLNNPHESHPNQNISFIDLAHPGTLPTINKKALEHMIRIGFAVEGRIANFTEFDRKNYFYPDIPKGYQISQYKYPIVSGGILANFNLTRIHLEEDTATSKHFNDYSLIDFNRAGTPLMELVTEPVLHSSEDVILFAKELQLILRYLGASDANIEKGEMRIEVNLSVSKNENFGTKVEVKNIGSISAAAKATDFEIKRQVEILNSGGEVRQETRGWNDKKEETFSQRSKENAKDYRYFPEPDLPKLYLEEIFDFDYLKKTIPELPQKKRNRYKNTYGIKEDDIEYYISHQKCADFFEQSAKYCEDKVQVTLISNYLLSDISSILKSHSHVETSENSCGLLTPESFSELIKSIIRKDINSRGAKDILLELILHGGDPATIAKEKKLLQENDRETLKETVKKIISEYPEQVQNYRNGKENILKFFIGIAMKRTKRTGNPTLLTEIFEELLKN